MNQITFIGDIHGQYCRYFEIINNTNNPTIQLGDFGFDYSYLENVNHKQHKILLGNHEHYENLIPGYTEKIYQDESLEINDKHFLWPYGEMNVTGHDIFYVAGEFSIDYEYRQKHYELTGVKTYFEHIEEYAANQYYEAILLKWLISPADILISHGCAKSYIDEFKQNDWEIEPSKTACLLDAMIKVKRPKIHIFAHMHIDKQIMDDKMKLVCVFMEPFVFKG